MRTDHLVEEQVAALFEQVEREQRRLDVVVNDISEGEYHDWKPFWNVSLEKGFRALRQGVHSHIITSHYAAPLMIKNRRGLIVEIGDGDTLDYRSTLFYDLVKISVNRFAYAMAHDLRRHNVAAVAVTPGFMRTEMVLDHLGVTEANWRDAGKTDKLFLESETPFYVGRAIAALAADQRIMEKSGGSYSSGQLAQLYGLTDIDGSQPDSGKELASILEKNRSKSRINVQWQLMYSPKNSRRARQ